MMAEYIEREKLLRDIEHYHVSDGKFQHWVEIQHAADVAPVRHGRWLSWEEQFHKTPKRKNNLGVFCDKCHKHNDNRTDYCPNCGARMDGGAEDEV